jgi:hypothetical protein
MGALSALPIVAAGNICCCLWVITGGVVAAYFLQQNQKLPVTPGEGALVGLLAGIAGSIVYFVLSIPVTFIVGPMQAEVLQRLIQRGAIPDELRATALRYRPGAFGVLIGSVFMLMVSVVFSTLGGLVGALVFRRQAPPTDTIDVTPER